MTTKITTSSTILQVNQFFENILVRCKALQLRRIKEIMILKHFEKDIVPIVNDYLPINDYFNHI